MTTRIDVRAQSEQMARARSVLAALCDRSGPAGLAAVEAFCILDDAAPPYPPLVELPAGTQFSDQDAIDALLAAVEASSDTEELARMVQAAEALRNPPLSVPWA